MSDPEKMADQLERIATAREAQNRDLGRTGNQWSRKREIEWRAAQVIRKLLRGPEPPHTRTGDEA
ncbi:hypothetical protein [Methylocaldum sp.]|uniref:hypothetical protein n=1 Tax=Methylocaldum sp. TaxID=1969727 RepID=UPI002D66107E|nr:hypothetical protein [Methylocaldum sp.]HYE38249.1 hypothetical protein [Methylocaldum sp.]